MRENTYIMRRGKSGALRTRSLSIIGLALIGLVLGSATAMVSAQQSVSPGYQVDEVFFGTGGELEACSADGNGDSISYCSKQSAGETAVGNTVSPGYQADAGFNTNREEYIELNVNASSTDLGVLSVGSAATTTGSFSVKSYLSSGYVVANASDPPKSGSTFLTNLLTPTASAPGTEQFGINLKDNSSPDVGAEVVQVPDNTFSFGAAASGYNTINQFKYVKGDIIAQSTRSSGQTNYTVSYLYNIKNTTPAGRYDFNHVLVATATF